MRLHNGKPNHLRIAEKGCFKFSFKPLGLVLSNVPSLFFQATIIPHLKRNDGLQNFKIEKNKLMFVSMMDC